MRLKDYQEWTRKNVVLCLPREIHSEGMLPSIFVKNSKKKLLVRDFRVNPFHLPSSTCSGTPRDCVTGIDANLKTTNKKLECELFMYTLIRKMWCIPDYCIGHLDRNKYLICIYINNESGSTIK